MTETIEEQNRQRVRLEMLERTVIELGTELFAMKSTVARNREAHEQFLGIVKGLKQLLDEKGLITLEDFEAAIDLGAALEHFNSPRDQTSENELGRIKKIGH